MKIHSIFESISGEVGPVILQGAWCTFIRMQGCNLRCPYCDTKDSLPAHQGTEMSIQEILSKVRTNKVVITGGEPFLQQADLFYLVIGLLDRGDTVQIETNGSYDPPFYKQWHRKNFGIVMDYKLGSSASIKSMLPLPTMAKALYRYKSALKFVICDEQDTLQAIDIANALTELKVKHVPFAFSPADAEIEFVNMIKDNVLFLGKFFTKTNFTINLQIHKILNIP